MQSASSDAGVFNRTPSRDKPNATVRGDRRTPEPTGLNAPQARARRLEKGSARPPHTPPPGVYEPAIGQCLQAAWAPSECHRMNRRLTSIHRSGADDGATSRPAQTSCVTTQPTPPFAGRVMRRRRLRVDRPRADAADARSVIMLGEEPTVGPERSRTRLTLTRRREVQEHACDRPEQKPARRSGC